ncbi:unnamed protein product [Arctogadus glacialis]
MALLGLESLLIAGRSDIKKISSSEGGCGCGCGCGCEASVASGSINASMPGSKEDISGLRRFLPLPSSWGCTRHWLLPTGPLSAAGPVAGAVAASSAIAAASAGGDSAPASSCEPPPCSSVTATTDTGDGSRCWRLEVVPLSWRNGARKPITPMYLHTGYFSLAPAPLLWASFSFILSLRYLSLRDLHLFTHSGTCCGRSSLLCFPPPGSATPPVCLTSHLALICKHAHLVFISNQPFINPWIPCCRCQIVLRTTVLSGSLTPARLPRSPPGFLIRYLLPHLIQ